MTNDQMNDLLADIISMYAAPHGRMAAKVTKKTVLKLVTSSVADTIENIPHSTYETAKCTLFECGTILEEDAVENTISGIIMSGSLNMNPAFVVIWADGTCMHIKASAKEGLIKQHTAEKAIAIFKSALLSIGDSCSY